MGARGSGLNRRFYTAAGQSLTGNGLFGDFVQPPYLIADADQEHRLPSILEQVNDSILLVFEKDGLTVRQQVEARITRENVGQPATHLTLQETKHAPNLLK